MANDILCARCGSSEMQKGALSTFQTGVFFLIGKLRLFAASSCVEVTALMCLACGSVELRGDVDQARKIAGKNN